MIVKKSLSAPTMQQDISKLLQASVSKRDYVQGRHHEKSFAPSLVLKVRGFGY